MPIFLILLLFISNPIQAQKLDTSYDIGKDLILLGSNFGYWSYNRIPWENEDYEPLSPEWGYYGIYWDPKQNEYYLAYGERTYVYADRIKQGQYAGWRKFPASTHIEDLIITNGLTYKLDLQRQPSAMTTDESEILYAGSLSPTKRLYINKYNTNIQYIKNLKKITPPFELYPFVVRKDDFYTTLLTNKQGDMFNVYTSGAPGMLYGDGKPLPRPDFTKSWLQPLGKFSASNVYRTTLIEIQL